MGSKNHRKEWNSFIVGRKGGENEGRKEGRKEGRTELKRYLKGAVDLVLPKVRKKGR